MGGKLYVPELYLQALYSEIVRAREYLDDTGKLKANITLPPEYPEIRVPLTVEHPLRISRKFYNAMSKKFGSADLLLETIWGTPPNELLVTTIRTIPRPRTKPIKKESPEPSSSDDESEENQSNADNSDDDDEDDDSESSSAKAIFTKPSRQLGSSQVGTKRPPSSSQNGPSAKRRRRVARVR